MLEMAFTMKRDAVTYPGPFGAPPTQNPEFWEYEEILGGSADALGVHALQNVDMG